VTGLLQGKIVAIRGRCEAATVVADAVRAAGSDVSDDLEHADALVHCGSPQAEPAAIAMNLDRWRAAHSDDLDPRFLDTAEFARGRLAARRPGAVLFVAPAGPGAARITANGAVDNLTKSLAVEWARDGLRVNMICTRRIAADGRIEANARGPLGALATYLLSDIAGYVSGCVMGIDET
jgi:NAD(P)-dependent dehydrogenase (short-subunit alcohol dehydrogenase family)